MRKILILLLVGFCLFGCLESKTVIKDAAQDQVTAQVIEEALERIPGVTPNTVIAYPRRLNEESLAIDFLAYKIKAEPVFGTAINLSYDSNVLEYVSYQKGDFLETGGTPTGNQEPVYLISPINSAESEKALIIGASLFRGTPGVNGSGRLLTLRFRIKKVISTEIVLSKAKLKGLQAGDINKIKWPALIPVGL
jgi:hypothetical protein